MHKYIDRRPQATQNKRPHDEEDGIKNKKKPEENGNPPKHRRIEHRTPNTQKNGKKL